jgi:hypothetical protein
MHGVSGIRDRLGKLILLQDAVRRLNLLTVQLISLLDVFFPTSVDTFQVEVHSTHGPTRGLQTGHKLLL